jgi:hypothetical protein
MSAPHTYISGMYLTATKPITKCDLVSLCKDLDSKHEVTGIKFEPEPITEGGIVCKFPDNSPHDEYKSIRMRFDDPFIKRNKSFIKFSSVTGMNAWKVSDKHLKKLGVLHLKDRPRSDFWWPCIKPNVMEEWENNEDIILHKGLSIGTYLKAFHGAPVFTENELKIFCECSEKIGLKLDSKIPKDKDLISYDGNLGKHRF